ncbi:glycosyltransferase [Pantoea sp. FN0305]|uniref:glycosyltransferase n=1 Tax=Pantoea sp. FN0305 TaxID=3418559 RepID=UPI003CF2698F
MRILMIIDGLPGGGAEKVVLTLAEHFIRQGDSVTLFSLRDICQYPLPGGLHYQVIADKCRAPWRKLTELKRRARHLDQAIAEAEQSVRFNLVLSHLHKTDRIVAHSKKLAQHNLWFCLHGVFSKSYLGHRTGFSRWLKQQKVKRVYQHRNIICVSDSVGRDLVSEFSVTPARLETIYNPFDIEAIRKSADESCELAGTDYLIHVGRFHQTKRHDRLLEAYAKSGLQSPLVLLGQGKPEQEAQLRQLAVRLDISDRVIFKGFQLNPLPWIRHAKLLVLSSDSEGFGNVLVEALLLDTPVVSTRCPGGPAEILTGELARGLCEMNADALAYAIRDIYLSPPVIDQALLQQRYNVENICDQYRRQARL